MTHHKNAARLIRELAVILERFVVKAQEDVDDRHEGSGNHTLEVLEERVDALEEAVVDLIETAENLELVP